MDTIDRTNQIALRRRELGLSGYAVAKKAGITPSHLCDIEKGRITSPSIDVALRLADALEADVRKLFGSSTRKAA